MKSKSRLLQRLTVLASLCLAPSYSFAGDFIWDGGGADGSWIVGTNWVDDPEGSGVPTLGVDSNQTFYAIGASNLSTFLAANRVIGTLSFDSNADSDVSVRFANASDGTTARNLTFDVATGDAAINVDADAVGNFILGVTGGSIFLNDKLVINHNGGGILTINRPISETSSPDPGPQSVTKNGSGTLTLTAANNFDGGLFMNSGTLNINGLNCLGGTALAPSPVVINGGAIDNTSGAAIAISTKLHPYTFNGDFTFLGTNNLSLSTGPVDLGSAEGTSRKIAVNAGVFTIGGVISNGTTANSLVKEGNGNLTLTGACAYDGTTLVNSGTFSLGTTGTLSGSSLTIGGAAATGTPTLAGASNIGVPTIIASAAGGVQGTHAVSGTSPGTQTFSSTLTYDSGAIFAWQVNPGQAEDPGVATTNFGLYDMVVASGEAGSVTGGSAVFRIALGGGFAFSDAFWDTDKTWSNVYSGTGAPSDLSAIFSTFSGTEIGSNGIVAGQGQFTFVGSTLHWTAGAAPSNAYDLWSAGLANPAFDFDSDNDGIENGLEWILGGNPNQNDTPSILHAVTGNATTGLTLTFTREEDSIPETTLSLEYSTDLAGPWTSEIIDQDGGNLANGVVVTVNEAASPDAVTISIPASNAPGGRLFARLKAVRN
ncbi:MAG: autotransporter-associated beta strand repeat-containing protein [Akkermansiaceae bacterium]